ncbi:GNAT family N-acetyltransferase [Gordonia sp. ABSL1-1]|uniref:N-acetylglutamate synthase, CG3035 family n=1 Tax=Gordonia sp. ABSL1-1 TaxID=3053923 RepID=UPI002573EF3A|nr:GNAT family N-acetyltransferase [Gordonia sp. ABSL1-1]MDL9937000.1 GNAT family N-acetyltransferase [Gordonia sp. ABSL1-1]
MISPATDLFVGDRVVVRYLLGDATPADWRGDHGAARSDVTGILLDDGDPLILERDGVAESIPRARITSVRLLSAKTVRNSEIRALEMAAAAAWPGLESADVDGWLLRAADGFSRRANCALPLDRSARPTESSLTRIGEWFTTRGLPTRLVLPDRLLAATGLDGDDGPRVQVLTRDLPADATSTTERLSTVTLADTLTPEWVRAYVHGERELGTATRVLASADGPVVFAAVNGSAATPIAIGRAAVTTAPDGISWLGLSAVWTDPAHRRVGLATTVVSRLFEWGVERGAVRAYVQVDITNRVAGSWYRRIGFGLHHEYRYLTLPAGGTEQMTEEIEQ